jgi:peptidoglycan/LPS O-acetylase OafA/YrhL
MQEFCVMSTGVGVSSPAGFRGDIQGLRAFAVVAVILNHLFDWPVGGFVGVDVFFVLSGYLITSLLLREQSRTGTISFRNFYVRRLRRIAPAAVLVLLASSLAAYLLFTSSRFTSTMIDAIWSFFFVGNWRFASSGTDYFQSGGALSPLQHYWSLGVEEQFYLVWPALLLLAFYFARFIRRPNFRSRAVVFSIIAVITAASFLWASIQLNSEPTVGYFSTFTRAWELGVGALLATGTGLIPNRLPAGIKPVAVIAGLVGILGSFWLVPAGGALSSAWLLLPVLSIAMVVGAGAGVTSPAMVILTNPVSQYVGRISYSLYLWHLPVIVLLAVIVPADSIVYGVLALVLTFALSAASFRFVEDPIRRSTWLEARSTGAQQKRRVSASRRFSRSTVTVVGASAAGLVAVFLVVAAFVPGGTAETPTTAVSDGSTITPDDIDTALEISAWPEAELTEKYLSSLQAPDVRSKECFNNFEQTDKACTYGESSDTTVALIGDSIAMSWAPAVRAALPEARLATFGKFSCPFVDILVSTSRGPEYDSCLTYHKWVYGQLEELKPDLVIVSTADFQLAKLSSGANNKKSKAEWADAMQPTLDKLTAGGASVVVLSNPPPTKSIVDCATALNSPLDCIDSVDGQWERMDEANRTGVKEASKRGLAVSYVDTSSWFCASDGRCPALFDGQPIRADGVHITEPYSTRLGPNLAKNLESVIAKISTSKQ